MAGRRGPQKGPRYDGWTVAKLKAELRRRGEPVHSWDKRASLLRRLKECARAADASEGIGTRRSPRNPGAENQESGRDPGADPQAVRTAATPSNEGTESSKELGELQKEVRQLRDKLARVEKSAGVSASQSERPLPCGCHSDGSAHSRKQSAIGDTEHCAAISACRLPAGSAAGNSLAAQNDVTNSLANETPNIVTVVVPETVNNVGEHGSATAKGQCCEHARVFTTDTMPTKTPNTTGHCKQHLQRTTGCQAEDVLLPGVQYGIRAAMLGKATPSGDLPHVEIVSPQLRADIIQGKDVNLASLLIQGFTSEGEQSQRSILVGTECIPLKPLRDHRLSRQLNLGEFVKAFTIYRNIMCEAWPHRRTELDAYLRLIVDMAQDFGGSTFYEYHKLFSARAAALLLNYNIRVDWSRRDNDLYCKLFAGRRAQACSICGSLGHPTGFCPLSQSREQNSNATGKGFKRDSDGRAVQRNAVKGPAVHQNDALGRPRVFMGNVEICNNFNGVRGCTRSPCGYMHACAQCKSTEHSKNECAHQEKRITSTSKIPAASAKQMAKPSQN